MFEFVLSEDEAMHVWAALGPSCHNERKRWLETKLKRKIVELPEVLDEVYDLLDNIFVPKGGHL